MKKLLLTTIQQPLGVENETTTKSITHEMYNTQVTLAQGIFSLRLYFNGLSLDFIAKNLKTPTTVLHFPTVKTLKKELKKGYDYIGINFVICTFPKAKEICELVRKVAPETKIILGGYGTVLDECDEHADYVCREEGVNFMTRILGEEEVVDFKVPHINRDMKILSVSKQPEAVLTVGLGCTKGCDFCATSHFFNKKYIPILKTGREIHEAIMGFNFDKSPIRNISIMDEDFLADKKKIEEMIPLNASVVDKPIFFSCMASLRSLSQYTMDELVSMGNFGVWTGIESRYSTYPKLMNIDAKEIIDNLKDTGIVPLTSLIIGFDWHDEKTVEEDFEYMMSLKPVFSQIMIYSPCQKTPLYERLEKEGRLLNVPYIHCDGFHALFKHPNFSPERLEELRLSFHEREYEELGPSLCRMLEVQLIGYQKFINSDVALHQARAKAHRELSFEIYPLLKTAIQQAPSAKVKEYLKDLKLKTEGIFQIPLKSRILSNLAPWLAFYTQVNEKLFPHPQPRVQIHHYNY
jgi:haloalkane dehalogenase